MNVRLTTGLLLLAGSTLVAQEPRARSRLLTASDAYWSAGFLVASVALSAADTRIAAALNDSAHRNDGRDVLARNVAKVQEGTLTVGNLAIWGIGRLVGSRAKPMDNADLDLYWRKDVTAELAKYALREVRGDDMREARLRIARQPL